MSNGAAMGANRREMDRFTGSSSLSLRDWISPVCAILVPSSYGSIAVSHVQWQAALDSWAGRAVTFAM